MVYFSDLKFKDDFEEAALRAYRSDGKSSELINLFLNPFENYTPVNRGAARNEIKEAIAYLKKETGGFSETKQVKFIYKYVHQKFFRRYNLNNSFTHIFENGQYNCVSASALYAIIFKELNIPYLVMEAPQHVYLITYPQSHKVLIESTSPTNGYFTFNDSYVQRYVRYLQKAKLISEDEFKNNSPQALFNTFYFDKNGMDAFDLAGIQYCNYAVYHGEENAYAKALEEVKKAYFISPQKKTLYMLQWAVTSLCNGSDYKSETEVKYLVLLCRLNNIDDKEISDENIKNEFRRLMHTQLNTNSDYDLMERSFNLICPEIKDSTLRQELSFSYHYELARLGYLNFKNKEYELLHLKLAYQINPKHADLQSIIKAYFSRLVDVNEDPASISKNLNEFENLFDFLKTDEDFNSIRANCFLEMAYQNVMLNNLPKADKYLADFEELHSKFAELKNSEKFVEKAYSSMASYYYKKGNVTKTKEYLKRGIKYAPENFGLRLRLTEAR